LAWFPPANFPLFENPCFDCVSMIEYIDHC